MAKGSEKPEGLLSRYYRRREIATDSGGALAMTAGLSFHVLLLDSFFQTMTR